LRGVIAAYAEPNRTFDELRQRLQQRSEEHDQFNDDACVQARKNRTEGNEYLGMLVDSGVAPISKRSVRMPAYVVLVCREIVNQEELSTYRQRVNGTLAGHSDLN
jgi:hypothetical protein